MRRNREDYVKRYNWLSVPAEAIDKAIKLNVPNHIKRLIATSTRKRDVLEWRMACVLSYWMNGETNEQATARYNREHSTIHNMLENLDNEYCGYANYNLAERIRLINYYAKYRVEHYTAEEYQIGDLIVSYNAFFEEEDEATGTVRGWVVDVVGVRGIVESEYLVGGIAEVPVHDYDSNGLSEIIKSKL